MELLKGVFVVARLLKEVDYFSMVVLLYKTSGLQYDLLQVLFNYTVAVLKDNNFNGGYIDKLCIDTNIFDIKAVDKSILELKLCDLIGRDGFIIFRASMFDIVARAYFG